MFDGVVNTPLINYLSVLTFSSYNAFFQIAIFRNNFPYTETLTILFTLTLRNVYVTEFT